MSKFQELVGGVSRAEQIQGTDIGSGSATSNQFLAADGAGGSAFRSLISSDIPNNAANTTGTASNITGVAAILHGGTNATTQTTNGIMFFNGTSIASGSALTWNAGTLTLATTGSGSIGGNLTITGSQASIGGGIIANQGLTINSSTQDGIVNRWAPPSTAGYGYLSSPVTAASTTVATLHHLRVEDPTIGSGGSVTRQVGLISLGLLTAATNNALIADSDTFTGNWFINQLGTLNSRFGGDVAIGTSTPFHSSGFGTLTLNGSTGGQAVFENAGTVKGVVYNDSTNFNISSGAGDILFLANSGVNERMRITNAGLVGIGLTPSFALDVFAPVASGVARFSSSHANGPFVEISNNGGPIAYLGSGATIFGGSVNDFNIDAAANNLVLGAGGVGLTISATGQKANFTGLVGIGVVPSGSALEISGGTLTSSFSALGISNALATGRLTTGSVSSLHIFADNSSLEMSAGSSQKTGIAINGQTSGSGSSLHFWTSDVERMTVLSTGQIGINNASPVQTLDVAGTAHITGSVGIGVTSTAEILDVNGNIQLRNGGGVTIGTVGLDGGGNFKLQADVGNVNGLSLDAPGPQYIKMSTNGSERARLTSAGDLGLGTASPTHSSGFSTFTLNGSTGGQIAFETAGSPTAFIYSGSTSLHITAAGNGFASIDYQTGSFPAVSVDNQFGNVILGNSAIPTNATNGFLYIVSSAGTPTGVPTSYTGRIPLDYDSVSNRLMAYNGGWVNVGSSTTLTAPTIQKFLSGSGTYTKPAGVLYIRVRGVGGGGGGAGSGTSGATDGSNGTDTTFGTTLLSAGKGFGGSAGTGGGNGGSASLGSGPSGIAINGARGGGGQSNTLNVDLAGGCGGSSYFGGAGSSGGGDVGRAASTNSGSGGGGGGSGPTSGTATGGAGGSGGFFDAIITSPSSTYPYVVGAGGSNGIAGVSGLDGGSGAAGLIEVTEYYQ